MQKIIKNFTWLILTILLIPFYLIVGGPIAVTIIVVAALIWFVVFYVYLLVRINWIPKGKYIFIVTSESPAWKEFMQTRVIDVYGENAVVINWSERKRWRGRSIESQVFHTILGYQEHTPSVVVFSPWYWPKVFRFFVPFKSYKRGKVEEVEALMVEMEKAISQS